MRSWLVVVAMLGGTAGAHAEPVFIDASAAQALVAQGATVIDARGTFAQPPYLPGAKVVDWMSLRDGMARTGKLTTESALRQAFGRAGVQEDHAVLVYGAAHEGWGEEGRVWWTLKYLGHPKVFILDGGVKAWLQAKLPHEIDPAPLLPERTWRSHTNPRARALQREVAQARPRKDVVVLDVRTAEEFAGATPYLSPRGGHVPGAKNLEWRELLAEDGRLKPRAQLNKLFATRGITDKQRVIAYCTGGVRSAFVVAALTHLGHPDVANYDGSWWEWSMQSDLPTEAE